MSYQRPLLVESFDCLVLFTFSKLKRPNHVQDRRARDGRTLTRLKSTAVALHLNCRTTMLGDEFVHRCA